MKSATAFFVAAILSCAYVQSVYAEGTPQEKWETCVRTKWCRMETDNITDLEFIPLHSCRNEEFAMLQDDGGFSSVDDKFARLEISQHLLMRSLLSIRDKEAYCRKYLSKLQRSLR